MKEQDCSISLIRANLLSIGMLIPLSAVLLLPYAAVWGWDKTGRDFIVFYDDYMLFLFLVVAGILVHELLHGVTWMKAGNTPWNAITFGFNWKALAPYAHCEEPIEINAYRLGAAMPGVVLGILPFLAGLITGHGWFTLFGYLFTITAAGDILILWLTRKVDSGVYVEDHPEQAGCRIIKPK